MTRRSRPDAKPAFRFDIAPAVRMPAAALVHSPTDDFVGRLVLKLALAYNDLKSTQLALHLIKELPAQTLETGRGESAGLTTHSLRMMSGISYEVFQVLRSESKTLDDSEVVAARSKLPRKARDAWDEIVSVARDPATITKTSPYWIARNKASFHYDDDLVRGFHHGFDPKTRAADGEPAYSDGDSMERTRFFFADVAARALVASFTGDTVDDLEHRFLALVGQINNAIKPMLIALLKGRSVTHSTLVGRNEDAARAARDDAREPRT